MTHSKKKSVLYVNCVSVSSTGIFRHALLSNSYLANYTPDACSWKRKCPSWTVHVIAVRFEPKFEKFQ